MIETIRKVMAILTPRERRRGALVLAMMALLAIIEVAGIASIMPFLAVLGNPGIVEENPYLNGVYRFLGFQEPRHFLIALGSFAALFLVFASAFRMLAHHAMFRYANMRRHSVSRRLLAGHLRQPYEFFLTRNSAELSKTILSEVDELTNHVIEPGFHVLAYSFAACAMIALLIVVDPLLAMVIATVLGSAYGLIYVAVRGVLGRIGKDRVAANGERFKSAAEALGGIKELKVLGKEKAFFNAFDPASARYARHQATTQSLGRIPKYLIEAMGFVAVIFIALYTLGTGSDLGQALPLLGLYVLAGYRLLPALQHIYGGMAKLRFGISAVDVVLAELNQTEERRVDRAGPNARLQLRSTLELQHASYTYPAGDAPALRDVSFSMAAHSSLGIVGKSGMGKSTLVDIILGLLVPQSGRILVDGRPLEPEDIPAWQRNIGYVPQHIFLVDDSITQNIALGVEPHEVDQQAVERAARSAQIHDFITGELPEGYATVIGERGVRLSGGQRQRLGIARALYSDPEILLLDEATSALDNATEAEVMETISTLRGCKTIIMVAHRLSTVRRCHQLLELNRGRAVRSGNYDEVLTPAHSGESL